MTQPGDFVGKWKIETWEPPDSSYLKLFEVQTDLDIIAAPAGEFELHWKDQCGNPCSLSKNLERNGNNLRAKSSTSINWQPNLSPQLESATVEFICPSSPPSLKVTLSFNDAQDGPKGTITAEADPPDDGLRSRRWSLFRWLGSLFR